MRVRLIASICAAIVLAAAAWQTGIFTAENSRITAPSTERQVKSVPAVEDDVENDKDSAEKTGNEPERNREASQQ
jgi:archaellin